MLSVSERTVHRYSASPPRMARRNSGEGSAVVVKLPPSPATPRRSRRASSEALRGAEAVALHEIRCGSAQNSRSRHAVASAAHAASAPNSPRLGRRSPPFTTTNTSPRRSSPSRLSPLATRLNCSSNRLPSVDTTVAVGARVRSHCETLSLQRVALNQILSPQSSRINQGGPVAASFHKGPEHMLMAHA